MSHNPIQLHESWMSALEDELTTSYFNQVWEFVNKQIDSGVVIYPHSSKIFTALDETPLDQVRVVILGQDPYH